MSLFHTVRQSILRLRIGYHEAFERDSVKKDTGNINKQNLDEHHDNGHAHKSLPIRDFYFGKTRDDSCTAAALLSRFGPYRLFFLPSVEIQQLKITYFRPKKGCKENLLRDMHAILEIEVSGRI